MKEIMQNDRGTDLMPFNTMRDDSLDKVICTILLDCSESMYKSGCWQMIVDSLVNMKNALCNDPASRAMTEIVTIRYGTETEIVGEGYSPIEMWPVENLENKSMNLTDTAKALDVAFDLNRQRIHHYHKEVMRNVYPPIILLISDGLSTSNEKDMEDTILKYDNYCRSQSGKRRIRIWGASMDDRAVEEMSSYCDQTFVLKDYESICAAIEAYSLVSSVLSSSQLIVDPVSGEEFADISIDIPCPEGIVQILPREALA